jgi:N-acetyl-gamma-glutamylphosphate reductase
MGGFGSDADLVFTPHLLPVARGILATITVPLVEAVANPLELWRERYAASRSWRSWTVRRRCARWCGATSRRSPP